MNMNRECEQLQDQYSDYFEHLLSPSQVQVFEAHVASCAACRADYHTFATMFQFLDRIDVAEVEAPSGLRADILTVIAQRPSARAFGVKSWLNALLIKPQLVWGSSLAIAACVVIFGVINLHQPAAAPPGQGNVTTGSMGGGGGTLVSSTANTPLLQTVTRKEGNSNLDYEYFSLHTPPSVTSSVNISAYVLQNGDAITNPSSEGDADKATPAWSGSLDPNENLSLPVAVTSDLPAGSSLNMLFDWTSKDGLASGREVAFVPITPAASQMMPVSAGTSFYDAIRTISGEYQQVVVADNSALAAAANPLSLAGTTGNESNADEALQNVLGNAGFEITVQPGGYYLISHP
jgi:hypothetical protein